MITWLPRSFWTDTPPGGHPKPHESFRRLVIHHTVMALPDFDRDGVFFGDLDDIREYMIRLSEARPDLYWEGRPEVPYSFVHFYGERPEDGIVVEGRGFGRTGAHTGNWNSKVYGCAAAGNFDNDDPTEGLLESFREVGRRCHDPASMGETWGHRDTKATACPGARLFLRVPELQPPFTSPKKENQLPEYLLRWDATGHVFAVYPSGRVRWIADMAEVRKINMEPVELESEAAFKQALRDANVAP